MNRVERLVQRYEHFVSLPWERTLAGPQRVWFLVHDKIDERRIRARLGDFELATKRGGHGWVHVGLTNAFPEWMAAQDYRDSFFEEPDDLDLLLPDFQAHVVDKLKSALTSTEANHGAIVAVTGIACLFGFTRVSAVVEKVASHIRGRLLAFFPGEHEDNNYRLLDARDGWNYMAVPITAHYGEDA